jgi:hypothetical protein
MYSVLFKKQKLTINFDICHRREDLTTSSIVVSQAIYKYTGCLKNGVLTVHYGVEEITVNTRKMLKKFYWTYFLIWRSLNVALNRSIILKYMYEIVMRATSNRIYYHKVQDHSLSISNPA